MRGNLPTAIDRDEALVAELRRLGVRHLARLAASPPGLPMEPAALLAALAGHEEARFRAALILLFLSRPQYSAHVAEAIDRLPRGAANTLRLYYQAAVYLQRELAEELRERLDVWQPLPDVFSETLGLPPARSVPAAPAGAASALGALGEAHRRITGWNYNWAASYRQNIPLFLKHLRPARGHRDA